MDGVPRSSRTALCLLIAAFTLEPSVLRGAELQLEEALARARAASPLVRAAAADVAAARGRLTQARLLPTNPVLSGELARHTEPGAAQIDRGVALAQEIEVGGQRGLRIGAADHDVARAEHLLADRRRLVDGEVRRSFFALAAGARRHALAKESATLIERLAEATRRRRAAGDVAALDLRLVEVERGRAAQAVAAAASEEAAAAARLALAIGASPDEEVPVTAADAEPLPLPAEVALVTHALATRPDLAAAREERARLEGEAGLARRSGLVPNPVLKGFYRQELFDERIAGGEVSVPLPVWNREQGREAALRAQAASASADADRLVAEIPRQIHLALVRHVAAAAVWRRYQDDTLPAATAAADLLARGGAAGYVGLPERLTQQDRLVQARAAGIDAWRDLHLAEADLIEAVGGALP